MTAAELYDLLKWTVPLLLGWLVYDLRGLRTELQTLALKVAVLEEWTAHSKRVTNRR